MKTKKTTPKCYFVKTKTVASASVAIVIAVLAGSFSEASAATRTWQGATNGLWSVDSNWGGTAPVNSDDLIFNTGSANTATNDFANNTLSLNSITFNGLTQTINQSTTNGISIGGGGVTAAASSGTSAMVLGLTLTANQIWSVGTNATLTVNRGFAMGANTVTKTGTGTLRLTNHAGTSSAGSKFAVQNGTLEALYQNDIRSTTAIEMGGGSTATQLRFTDGNNVNRLTDLQSAVSIVAGTTGAVTINNTVLSSVTSVTLSGAINLGTATDADLVFNTTTGSVTRITGPISGSMTSENNRGNFTFSGGNGEVQFLNANNSFTGVRTFGILQGTVVLGVNDPATGTGNGALGNNTTAIFVGTSASPTGSTPSLLLDGAVSTGRNITVGNAGNSNSAVYTLGGRTADASSFSGGITLNRNVELTAAAGGTVTFSNLINDGTNTQSVTKVGNGTVNLSRAVGNTYDGGTLVTAGTLLLSNTSGSATGSGNVTVGSAGAIGGNGIIAGNLTLIAGADFVFSLTDTLKVNGASVSFGGFSISDVVGLNSSVALGTYTLIGGTATFDFTNVSNFGSGNAFNLGGGKSAYFQSGSLQVVVIPEPSTWLLLALGLIFVTIFRRTRRLRAVC